MSEAVALWLCTWILDWQWQDIPTNGVLEVGKQAIFQAQIGSKIETRSTQLICCVVVCAVQHELFDAVDVIVHSR